MKSIPLIVAAGLAWWAASTPNLAPAALADKAPPPPVDGAWVWDFTMPDGATVSPKVTLTREGDRLTGVAAFRPGSEIAITEGRIGGDQISFQVVRERDGREVVTKYSGRIIGGTIHGKIESNWAGAWQTYDWEASKPLIPPDSVWRSVVRLPSGRPLLWRLQFKQERTTLTGKLTTSGRPAIEIKNGTVHDDEISFAIERRRQGQKSLYEYRGKVIGDAIKGKVNVTTNDKTNTYVWTATRPQTVIDGRWEWTRAGNQKRELELKRSGDKLTGKFIVDEKHEYEIENGRFTGVEVYFEVERERDADKTLSKFKGTMVDDRIVGKIEFSVNDGPPQNEDWEAIKADETAGRDRNRDRDPNEE